MFSLAVYCSAHEGIASRYLDLAEQVGTEIGRRGWTLVWGAGQNSMMGAVARGAKAHGARTIGVIPEAMIAWEVADRQVDEFIVTRDMRQRKGIMDERCDAFLALPGGLGTLEELFEVWTASTLQMHAKPIVVLDPWDDFGLLRAQMEHLVESGFVRRQSADAIQWCVDIGHALENVARSVP